MSTPQGISRGLTFLFAVAGGAAVANLYWAQPLLDTIGADLHAPAATVGWLITATQIGYAVGVVLIVPLGDALDRRRLIPVMLFLAAATLVGCALAPTIGVLLGVIALLGVTTVAGQILVPLAGDLAQDDNRGQVVGTVASGILTGILVSRTLSGLVAALAGWRTVYTVAAVLDVLLAVLLLRAIPPTPPRERLPYFALLASVATVIRRERTVRWTLVLGATGFGVFTLFWTALTFLLSAAPFRYPVAVIGLFGLAGLGGAVAAQRAGRLHDRGWSLPATGIAWALSLVSFGIAAMAGTSVVLLIVAVVLLDVAIQASNLLNQSRMFAVAGEARSRANTAFVAGNFVGGAIGSAAAGLLWAAGGWTAITLTGAALSLFGLLVWAAGRRAALVVHRR